ncbi:methylated-DNA--[protein]-cysteine S-methyltransferase [Paenibacillaceae sp. P-4]|uniref:methylated-DNA--[protein]-cysteine S-methyltransferase n=1 Tax=Paenibacillaceae bacterium P-4 TaxID=3160969 RepID=UPI0032E84D2C
MGTENLNIYWSLLQNDAWHLHIAASERGLCYISGQNESFEQLSQWAERHYPAAGLVRDDERMQPYVTEAAEYLAGHRAEFAVPLDIQGTPFQCEVWEALCAIPYGETRTYSEIAEQVKKPKAARAVGSAIGANPILITVPCHRVIGKDGSITGYRGGLEMKRRLLHVEQRPAIKS